MQSPQQIADKWAARTANAGQAYADGIRAVTESPTQKAAAAADRYAAGVQRAVSSGRFQGGLLRVSLQDWQRNAIEKGQNRLATGVNAAKGKMSQFLAEFLPHLAQLDSVLASMPRGGLEENIARANAVMRHNAQFRRRS